MIIERETLYECWRGLNEDFLVESTGNGMLMPSRDFSRVVWPVRLVANNGFGLPDELPPFFADYSRRVKLLAGRYIDMAIWQEGVDRLVAREKRMALRNPLSFVINFHRRATKERKVPAGGGCLQTITFIWCNGRWSLMVFLRASEITARLLADMVFVQWAVNQVRGETRLKKWGEFPLEIVWDIGLASQMKYLIAPFLLYTRGEKACLNYFVPGSPSNDWEKTIIDHFWDVFIYPEHINWAQRRKWSEKFVNETTTDWPKAKAIREEIIKCASIPASQKLSVRLDENSMRWGS